MCTSMDSYKSHVSICISMDSSKSPVIMCISMDSSKDSRNYVYVHGLIRELT